MTFVRRAHENALSWALGRPGLAVPFRDLAAKKCKQNSEYGCRERRKFAPAFPTQKLVVLSGTILNARLEVLTTAQKVMNENLLSWLLISHRGRDPTCGIFMLKTTLRRGQF